MKRVLVALFVLWAACLSAQALPFRWHYGDPVYGHEVNWNFDELESRVDSLTTSASVTVTVATTTARPIFILTGLNYYQLHANAATQFKALFSMIDSNNSTMGGEVSGTISYSAVNGTYKVGSFVYTKWTESASSLWDFNAAIANGGQLYFIASAPSTTVKVQVTLQTAVAAK